MDIIDDEAGAKSVTNVEDAFGTGRDEFALDFLARRNLATAPASAAQAECADFKGAKGLLQRFLERAPNRHRLADRFHLSGQRRIGLREFLEREPRNFDDHIVNRGFE